MTSLAALKNNDKCRGLENDELALSFRNLLIHKHLATVFLNIWAVYTKKNIIRGVVRS